MPPEQEIHTIVFEAAPVAAIKEHIPESVWELCGELKCGVCKTPVLVVTESLDKMCAKASGAQVKVHVVCSPCLQEAMGRSGHSRKDFNPDSGLDPNPEISKLLRDHAGKN